MHNRAHTAVNGQNTSTLRACKRESIMLAVLPGAFCFICVLPGARSLRNRAPVKHIACTVHAASQDPSPAALFYFPFIFLIKFVMFVLPEARCL
jgi:hypothetical protein